jgi:predicted ArsR family transcriptional regulator
MSSDHLEKKLLAARPAADRLLVQLKTRGPQSAAELGAALGVTGEAARQQLAKLTADGLVEAMAEAGGVGRPKQVFRLTAAGHARFPDAHAELTVQLLRTVRTELGEGALGRLLSAREAAARASYLAEMAGAADLGERVARLADIRRREGYMAEWWAEGDGFVLVENHCPICAAATACQGFCESELSLFRATLGPGVAVERTEHIVAGARRCAYRISPGGSSPGIAVPRRRR